MDTGPRLAGHPDLPREYTFVVNATGPSGPVERMTYVVDVGVIEETVLNPETVEGQLKALTAQLKELTEATANDRS